MYRKDRNQLYEVINEVGLDGCQIHEVKPNDDGGFWSRKLGAAFGGHGVVINHPTTGSIISIIQAGQGTGQGYTVSYHVTDGPQSNFTMTTGLKEVLRLLRYWARETKYVAENPDLWQQALQASKILVAAQTADSSNARFTAEEQAHIARSLDEVKQLVRDRFELTGEQLAAIDQRLDDAKEAAKHTDRKTWAYTFYGAVMSLVLTDAIPQPVVQTVLAAVVHGVAHFFGIGGPPPMITT